jgi:hypothetical protein
MCRIFGGDPGTTIQATFGQNGFPLLVSLTQNFDQSVLLIKSS